MTLKELGIQISGEQVPGQSSPTLTFASGTTAGHGSPGAPSLSSPLPKGSERPPDGRHCDHCSGYTKDTLNNEETEEENPEQNLNRPLHGWPELAKLMEQYPDLQSFQSFQDLNLKSLLYYQGELDMLREELQYIEWHDHRESTFKNAPVLCQRVDKLLGCAEIEDETHQAHRQLEVITRIRKILKEYNEALLLFSQVSALPEADSFNVNSLRNWLTHEYLGNLHIGGPGSNSWGDLEKTNSQDARGNHFKFTPRFLHLIRTLVWPEKPKPNVLGLIVPRQGRKYDGLAKWVANEFVPFCEDFKERGKNTEQQQNKEQEKNVFKRILHKKRRCSVLPCIERRNRARNKTPKRKEEKLTLKTWEESRMLQFTSFVATVIACLLPTIAIAVLSKLNQEPELIGLIALFTALFAMGLMFLTDAGTSRVEIFTATAAFSAVMVVFVQNQGTIQVDSKAPNITVTPR